MLNLIDDRLRFDHKAYKDAAADRYDRHNDRITDKIEEIKKTHSDDLDHIKRAEAEGNDASQNQNKYSRYDDNGFSGTF